jgi:transposase-like protein
MKTQMRKPSGGKSHYAAEYKHEAVERWKNSGRSAAAVAAELGIRAPLLYCWAKEHRLAGQQGGQPVLERPERVAALEERIRQLTEANPTWSERVVVCG